eukprot:TRINITY_DN1615_c0_g1_i1.p3 TRINITY_DN1615_c0_g1~~TRINITY_DN1615_c0_g1_i1.p3  ORF type:complete len:114 (-),score=36.68 TRINITY_DN1615_c0_g1_i1:111-452(-)
MSCVYVPVHPFSRVPLILLTHVISFACPLDRNWINNYLLGLLYFAAQYYAYDLLQAANYLDIKSLLDLTCKTVANMIKGKTPEEIRKTFNIKNDFTPEEEEQVRKENAWCEEK